MHEKILVAIDRSEMNSQVFNAALNAAKTSSASLMLLHVLSPQEQGYPTPRMYTSDMAQFTTLDASLFKVYHDEYEKFEREGLDLLRWMEEKAIAENIKTEFTQNFGSPGRTICELAKSWSADLIIIGRRGHSGIKELVLGSISNYVTHHAPCSVLLIQGIKTSDDLKK